MLSPVRKRGFERRLEEAGSLVEALEALPDGEARRAAVEAVRAVLAVHGEALAHLVGLLEERGDRALLEELARDPMVGGLLLLHGLHPTPLLQRVSQALDRVRPYLGSHGGSVQLLGLEEGVVRLRLEGSCHGCPSSRLTLEHAIEQAIQELAPEVAGIEVEGLAPEPQPSGFVPLSQLRSEWREVPGLTEGPPSDGPTVREVAGVRVLLCRLPTGWYAYRDRCPACGASLEGAVLEDVELACPGCGRRFDARRAGRSLDGSCSLEPVPLLSDGAVRIALPVGGT
ncbi:MAG TPA: NifU family protein [Candidatus Dormibacteraeota bacterium]|nr:NifU family protein [Candidatus Dormibacteraeota bacterium]